MRFALLCFFALLFFSKLSLAKGELVEVKYDSRALSDNLVNINPQRNIIVYLPESYASTKKRYPVLYFFHNIGWSNRQTFSDQGNNMKALLDEQMASKDFPEAIVVAGDFSTDKLGSLYGNAASSGRWLDHIHQELIPWVDENFRTFAQRESRAALGDSFGGYVAIKLAMFYPELFSVVYSMHPVATDTGETLMISRPDWTQMNTAKTWEDLESNIYSTVFMLIAQGYLPNPKRPPFYADFMVDLKGDELIVNSANIKKIRENFLLARMVPDYADNLKKLKALKMDWGRYDENPDHVYANQKFTRLLEDYGVKHEAEEYSGNAWNRYWIENGRMETDVLPFISRHLQFD